MFEPARLLVNCCSDDKKIIMRIESLSLELLYLTSLECGSFHGSRSAVLLRFVSCFVSCYSAESAPTG